MNKYLKLSLITVVFILAIVGIGFLYNSLSKNIDTDKGLVVKSEDNNESDSTKNEQKFIDFTVVNKDKNEVKLSSLVGKPMVVNFWASWCSPCKMELPDFEKAYKKYGSDVQFVMVNMTDGTSETFSGAKKFVESNNYTFDVYYDINQDAAKSYSIYSIPTTYFFNADGKVEATAKGMINMQTLENGIKMITAKDN